MNKYDQNRLNDNPAIAEFYSDIPQDIAERAYYNTSHFPERAASIVKAEYASDLIQDRAKVQAIIERAKSRGATVPDDYLNQIDAWFPEHREGLKGKYLSYLHSHSNVASSFICGPANFPVARMQKRSQWADNHWDNIGKFRHTSKRRIVKQLLPYGDGSAVRTNDPDAVEKIDTKLQEMEKQKEFMKSINRLTRKFYKRTDTPEPGSHKYIACVKALKDAGLSEGAAIKAIEPDYNGLVPFPSWQISNLNANIRRYKQRSQEVEQTQSIEINDQFPGGESATVSDDGKIVIDFGYKPSEEVRSVLKSNAFKWSRARMAWVRKLTGNAQYAYETHVKPMLEAHENA